jgi:hypothetical protein
LEREVAVAAADEFSGVAMLQDPILLGNLRIGFVIADDFSTGGWSRKSDRA